MITRLWGWVRMHVLRRGAVYRGRPAPGVTPAQAADLAAARAAQQRIAGDVARVQAVADVGLSRWPRVEAVRLHLERIRRENHLADDVALILRTKR